MLCRGRPAGVLYAVPRAAGGVDASHGEGRGWGRWVHSRTPFSLSARQHTKRGLYSTLIVRTFCVTARDPETI